MIQQAHISKSLQHFEDGFRKLWNLQPITDPLAPALFVGLYSEEDLKALFNHPSKHKYVLFGGADIPNARRLPPNITIIADISTEKQIARWCKNPIRNAQVAFRDYSNYRPVPLGDKIYCYQAHDNAGCRAKYHFDMLQQVIEVYGDRVIVGYHPHTEEEMWEIYRSSFINIQFNPMAGFTSALEMAHMGRPSISNHHAPFCMAYTDMDDVLTYIEMADRRRKVDSIDGATSTALLAKKFLPKDRSWLRVDVESSVTVR